MDCPFNKSASETNFQQHTKHTTFINNTLTIMYTKIIDKFTFQSIFVVLCVPFLGFCLESDTISSNIFLKDPDTIVSRGHIFKLGFFSPQNSANRYLAIFYTVSEESVIWIANRNKPLKDSSGTVTISQDGNLVLIDGQNQTVWSTNATTTSLKMNTTVQIQDNGNLVLRDDATGTTIWDSFSHPTNVFVPTSRLTDNINTGKKVVETSWKNESDPEEGSFTKGIQALNIPQLFIWNNGRPHWRSGPWNGRFLIGIWQMYDHYADNYDLFNESDGTLVFTAHHNVLMKIVLNSSGTLVQTTWNDQRNNWDITWVAPQNECEVYGTCGPFGSCNAQDSPICSCLKGFEPANKDEWERRNWTSGCQRRKKLRCDQSNNNTGNGNRFLRMQFMKVPDFAEQFPGRNKDECRITCLRNCSCIAYAYDPEMGCMFWRDNLIDIQKFASVGTDLYIRLSASELDNHKDKELFIIIPVLVAFVSISILIFIGFCWMVKRKGEKIKEKQNFEAESIISSDEFEKVNIDELPLFSFKTLADATDQFHEHSFLGEGGFGSVYKGTLTSGEEIAVKRLSSTSGQGMKEFMNEVIVISKLQHRNLVGLLGCCVEKGEKMLIYEYMSNKSLDICLFDHTHPAKEVLDWKKRFSIIEGIARGLLYLHKDSRLRIIHRDLKLGNILLDENLDPKISDFGMARIFGANQDHDSTSRVAGTYGYMAPEYAMEGRFSEKSDVYSFGVLMLEIVKGKKNTNYYNHEWSLSLLGCAWKLWNEDNGLAFADETVASAHFQAEIIRCIQIALLCVQENPKDRPSIQTVISMLSHEIVDLPAPNQPIFAEKWNGLPIGSTRATNQVGYSIDELTITVLDGR